MNAAPDSARARTTLTLEEKRELSDSARHTIASQAEAITHSPQRKIERLNLDRRNFTFTPRLSSNSFATARRAACSDLHSICKSYILSFKVDNCKNKRASHQFLAIQLASNKDRRKVLVGFTTRGEIEWGAVGTGNANLQHGHTELFSTVKYKLYSCTTTRRGFCLLPFTSAIAFDLCKLRLNFANVTLPRL